MKITDPLIELLAIKLYEHDHKLWSVVAESSVSWLETPEEDREYYRELARGERDLS